MKTALTAFGVAQLVAAAAALDLKILHLNDVHSRIEGIDINGGSPKDYTALSDGGWPRVFTAAKQLVQEAKDAGQKVIYVDDGDEFMGNIWSSFYRGEEAFTFLSMFCDPVEGPGFDACVGTFGNHEFDYGYDTIATYTKNLTETGNFHMISSNIVDNCDPAALGDSIAPSHVVDLDGVKVGFVAYTTTETPDLSSPPDCLAFNPELESINTAAAAFDEDVKIVIAIGHAGYKFDQELAASATGVDLIVSGHSHTFLWTATEDRPNPVLSQDATRTTTIEGEYATVVNGIPIVQVYFGGRFLGNVDLVFDDEGVLTSHTDRAILLGSDGEGSSAASEYQFALDEAVVAKIVDMSEELNEFRSKVVGKSLVLLDGERSNVRSKETNLGNLFCDAMLASTAQHGAQLCLMNGGGLRASIDVGDITVNEVIDVAPFGNVLSVIEISGEQVKLMVEHGLSGLETSEGRFGHFGSGFYVEYSLENPSACGSNGVVCLPGVTPTRVVTVELNGEAIEDETMYRLVTNDFLARGGDGYKILSNITEDQVILATGDALEFAFERYVSTQFADGIDVAEECRIARLDAPSAACSSVVPTAAPTISTSEPTSAPTSSPTTPTSEPTSAPTSSPTTSPTAAEESENTGALVGALIGGLLLSVLMLVCGVYYFKPIAAETEDGEPIVVAADNPRHSVHSGEP